MILQPEGRREVILITPAIYIYHVSAAYDYLTFTPIKKNKNLGFFICMSEGKGFQSLIILKTRLEFYPTFAHIRNEWAWYLHKTFICHVIL